MTEPFELMELWSKSGKLADELRILEYFETRDVTAMSRLSIVDSSIITQLSGTEHRVAPAPRAAGRGE
jgi:hypothetical protein